MNENVLKTGKTFLYLVQGKGVLPQTYSNIKNDRSDILQLTWKDKIEGAIYFPGSSWTEGRNKLISEALQINHDYLYYIFLDDDVEFEQGDWQAFEDQLLKYQPAVATPYLMGYPHNQEIESEAQTCFMFDAMYNAYHKDVLKDKFLLPYFSGFDKKSWWYSQSFVIHLMHLFFPNHTLQMNTIRIKNAFHGEYPKSSSFAEGSQWFYRHVLKPDYRKAFVNAGNHVFKPSAALNTYCIPVADRKEKVYIHSTYWSIGTKTGRFLFPMSVLYHSKIIYPLVKLIKTVR